MNDAQKIVLLVDDDTDQLIIYNSLLSHFGYTVLVAQDFPTGIELARAHLPDLVITDLDFGPHSQYDGVMLAEELRAHEPTRDIPVIVNTAFADLHTHRLRALGCPVVNKPSPDALLQLIEETFLENPRPTS